MKNYDLKLTNDDESAMIGHLLSDLVERKITSVKEIAALTDKGPSTIYRWLKGETQPDIAEVIHLIHHLSQTEGRKALVEMFAQGMPVRIEWLSVDQTFEKVAKGRPPEDVLDLAMLTIECLSKVMLNQRQTFRDAEVSRELKSELSQLLSTAINYLALAQQVVEDTPVTRKSARPIAKPSR